VTPEDERKDEERRRRGQGYSLSPKERRFIEVTAMNRAREHFIGRGYDVEDVHKDQHYDLKCRKGEKEVLVEVKGTTGTGRSLLLTGCEVDFARKHSSRMALMIVHSINLKKKRSKSNGSCVVIQPWNVEDGRLEPRSYAYEPPV
jgi:hypothetical protein